MEKTIIPENYQSSLDAYQTQTAIGFIKKIFEKQLEFRMHLKRVSAPLFVSDQSGLNDNLSGVERPVSFDVPALDVRGEVVHSLAKWKRTALHDYDFRMGNGLYTDMNAIRRDEVLDNTHSIYVDQWDWERVISKEERNLEYLKKTVQELVDCFVSTLDAVKVKYPDLNTKIKREVAFISSQDLEDLLPHLTPDERELVYVKAHPTAFIYEIGHNLKSGVAHSMRAPDYDDWLLNGDLVFWHEPLGCALELSSMGIRVDSKSMQEQLVIARAEDRLKYDFHQAVIADALPLSMGGGIGQSRMCMLLLGKAHIGEVQVSLWDEETVSACKGKIDLL